MKLTYATSGYLNEPRRSLEQAALEHLRVQLEQALNAAVNVEACGIRGDLLRLINLSLQDCVSDCKSLLEQYQECEREMRAGPVVLFDEAAS